MIKWVVDTVVSYHATPNSELFTTYKVGDFRCVKMGNTVSFNIVGIGDNLHANQRRLPVEAARCKACFRFTPQLEVRNCLSIKKASIIISAMVDGNSPKERWLL